MLRARRSTSPVKGASTHRSPTRHSPVKSGTYDSELIRVLRERDELQNMLEKYERHLSETQGNVKVLTAERDKTRMHYQQAQEEIAALRREVMKSKAARGPKNSVTAQSILKRLEAERDEATSDLHRMSTERDSLRERLKISQETAISERAHLEQRVEDLQAAVLTLEQERGDQKGRQVEMRETMIGLEEEVHTIGRKLNASDEELSRLRNECSSLRLSNSQMESSLSENQWRLTSRTGELQNIQEKNKLLDEKNESLVRQVTALQEDVSTLQGRISELDQQRNTLQVQLGKKTDLLCTANNQLNEKEKTIRGLKLRSEDLETTLIAQKETVIGKERELDVLKRKMSDSEKEVVAMMKVKDALLKENIKLRDDHDKAHLDKQALQLKLEKANQEIEYLQGKVHDHIADISRTEDLLSVKVESLKQKEGECRDLQESRRKASVQVESLEKQARQAETTITELRLELCNSNSEILRLKERAGSLESSLQEALSAERSCNSQLSQLNLKLIHLEDDFRQAQTEHTQVQSDLEKTRELCIKLDASKEAVQHELESCRSEMEQFQKQLASERLSVQSLESLLVSAREKELQRQLTSQERQTEIQILKDKLSMADSKVSCQSREMAQLRTRSAELEGDLEMTKRHLSTECYERERAVQELHRQGLSAIYPVLSSTMRSLSPSRHRFLSPHKSWSPERSDHNSSDSLLVSHHPNRSQTFTDLYG
ncbi:testis-specific gene 10 protein-like [Myxocyprinus asiaticus]|uniref:testis-specific gene 10 protein-like n=1 Tax=Myxocyprinus asiaticus TaxID=70543 RepID=UPI0022223CC8|nr:testis-specific gene 10 protein-like [Myxocyprinus asiaticus]